MTGAVSREGSVHSMADTDRAAAGFAKRWDLHVGEVMQFSNGYYATAGDLPATLLAGHRRLVGRLRPSGCGVGTGGARPVPTTTSAAGGFRTVSDQPRFPVNREAPK
jgi:hypothetical protein